MRRKLDSLHRSQTCAASSRLLGDASLSVEPCRELRREAIKPDDKRHLDETDQRKQPELQLGGGRGWGGGGGSKGGRLGGGRLGGGVYEAARAPPVGEASAAVFKDRSDDCLSLLRRARADVYVTALL